VNADTNPTSTLADHGTVLQGVVDPFHGVFFHANQETRAKLPSRSASIEKYWGRVCEVPLRHEVVRLKDTVHVRAMDPDGDAHDQVLRPLNNATVEAE
jgi:hypothetical protein